MARMADLDDLLEKVAKIQASGGSQEQRVGEIIIAITNAPTAEVVRCKDCRHYREYAHSSVRDCASWGKCKLISMDVDMPENGYCCYGERR